MSDEAAILSAVMFDRAAYDTVVDHVDPTEFSALAQATYEAVQEYYSIDPKALRCEKDIIRTRIGKALPKASDALAVLFKELSPERGATNVVREVLEMKRATAGNKLSMAIAAGKSAKELAPILEAYTQLNDATDLGGGFAVLEKSYGDVVRESGDPGTPIKIYPQELNKLTRGGMLPGHCLVIIGRVNVGKSALALYNVAGQMRDGKKVLLIENEDLPDDVKRRIGCCLVGCSIEWAEANPDEFDKKCKEKGGDNLIIPDPVPATTKDVSRAIEFFKPDVCMVNQVRHLAAAKDASNDNTGAVDRVVQQLRAMGKRTRTCMVLVGAALEGQVDKEGNIQEKAILSMADSYGSKTGIPGCADIMIGIGSNAALEAQGKVAITLCKNKRQRQRSNAVIYKVLNGENCRFTGN